MSLLAYREEVAGARCGIFCIRSAYLYFQDSSLIELLMMSSLQSFLVLGADSGPAISEDSGDNGSFPGTSLMEISNVAFVNFTGYLSGNEGNVSASVSCSNVQ